MIREEWGGGNIKSLRPIIKKNQRREAAYMSREEFLEYARSVIHDTMTKRENRLMTLVEQAYGAGRKSETARQVTGIVREVIEQLKAEPVPVLPDLEDLGIDDPTEDATGGPESDVTDASTAEEDPKIREHSAP